MAVIDCFSFGGKEKSYGDFSFGKKVMLLSYIIMKMSWEIMNELTKKEMIYMKFLEEKISKRAMEFFFKNKQKTPKK